MASFAALLPASVAMYLATAPRSASLFTAVEAFGDPLDIGAGSLQTGGVGDDVSLWV